MAVYNQLVASLDSNLTTEPPPVGDIVSKAQPDALTFETGTSAIRGAMEDNSDTIVLQKRGPPKG